MMILLLAAEVPATPREVFEKRLLPIFKSPDPSSCVQCHLAGVALKDYIRPSHEETFASLRDAGLIDLDKPAKSRILALIRMGEGTGAPVQEKVRKAELDAFADWIARSAADPKTRALPKAKKPASAHRPGAVVRHARKDRVLESFERNIWPMRFRCMGCHTEGSAESRKHAKEHGARVEWFKAAGPEATLDYLRSSRLIDIDAPEKSLLLRKPLDLSKHGGGKKFAEGDQGHKAFRAFIDDYARIAKDGYADTKSLPKTEGGKRFGSDIWLKLEKTPAAWGDKLLQVDLHAWDAKADKWQDAPVATSDRVVWGKGRLWQHNLTLLGQDSLRRGKYLVKVRVDAEGRLAKDWKATLGPKDLVGSAEVESAWPAGYGKMTALDASKVK
ncbi:MAG: hypothetical protein K2W96_06860 [Gemmataceae bacterium]|nr:hypothetical protein [Gemmataceae bacterium]